MRILYHLTVLPPPLPDCEALSQEIVSLRQQFTGDVVYINPNQKLPVSIIPRMLFGFHQIRTLRKQEAAFTLHHLYNPDPFPFPVLRWLRRPVIYTISSGLGSHSPNTAFFNRLAAVTVYDKRSLQQLEAWGIHNAHLIPPGINTSRFTCTPLPLDSGIRVLVASAPWTKAQFHSKGIDALLDAAKQFPKLKLILLWRGVLEDEIQKRIRSLALEDQVQVIHGQVDVNQMLASAHATVALAATSQIIKAYPHSLLDSLAAGKPVLVSRAIPMADYVEETGCGDVVEAITPTAILNAIESLARHYPTRQRTAQKAGSRDFPLEQTLSVFGKLYQQVSELS
ncbi:MAG: glycosyltransferase [Anaerolineales bacterium]|nr:glycosyltransferase [Anaerolineales bacterium]